MDRGEVMSEGERVGSRRVEVMSEGEKVGTKRGGGDVAGGVRVGSK